MRVHGLISRHHICPVFSVVVGIDERKHSMGHVPVLIAAGEIGKIELDGLAVW